MDTTALIAIVSIFTSGITIALGCIGPALGEGRATAQEPPSPSSPGEASRITRRLFVSLAMVESTATRLMAMQAAERNIEGRLEDMNTDYRRLRQESITGELLDGVAGFEALSTREDAGTAAEGGASAG